MSLRALGRQFTSTLSKGAQKVKQVNDFLKEDEREKLRESPLETETYGFEEPRK